MNLDNASIWTDSDLEQDTANENKFIAKKRKELLKAENRRRNKELNDIKSSHRYKSERMKKMTTTKILMYFILINCTVIELYSMYVMYILNDLSPLYSLIGAVIGESLSYAIYCAKSFNDSKSEANAKLESDSLQLERDRFTVALTDDERNILDGLVPDDVPQDDDHSGDIPQDAEIYEESSIHADDCEY